MSAREDKNRENEILALELVIEVDNWISAEQLSMRIGRAKSRQIIACALARLERQGKIEKTTIRVPSKWRSTGDDVTHYRIPGVSVGIFTAWFKPQLPKFEKMSARVVRLLGD